jgi:hypothetical protein
MHATTLQRRLPWEPVLIALAPALFAVAIALSVDSPTQTLAIGAGATFVVWVLLSERYERTLAVLLLYLGLLDGFLRMRTGMSELTLVRDVLLWSIAGGALARTLIRRESLRLPPLSGWVALFVAIVLVQLFNPHDGTIVHSFAGVRQHLQFVPLFFLGYLVMRTNHRLRMFLLLLLVVGAANGVVGYVQFNLTPEQLAQWGPGYAERVAGTGDVSGRGFVDARGNRRTRPFGLGSDMGVGGHFGLLALTAGLALIGLSFRRRWGLVAVPLLGGAVLAIVTSQARTVLIGAVLAAFAFIMLGATARRRMSALGGVVVAGMVAFAVVSVLSSNATDGAFDRYRSITPDAVVATSTDYREDDLSLLGGYMADYPLGAGLGSAGPATSVGGRPAGPALNAEGQFNFLVIELGVLGLLAYLGVTLAGLWLAVTRCRLIPDPETRLLLAAIAAPLFAIFVLWISGITSTSSPGAPYFWFATGTLAFWLGGRARLSGARIAPPS